MNHRKLVLPGHMNAQGSLFGGYLLLWLDEFAFITAQLEFPGRRFVTIAMNNVEFRHPIACGQILRFSVTQGRLGTTSVDYNVEVIDDRVDQTDHILFATRVTFVNLDAEGRKTPIVC